MNEELADACIEFPEELCLKLQDFTDTHMPSSSYQRIGEAQMESDSDNHSEASTATTARRAWELQGDEPQDDEQDEEQNAEQDAEQNEELVGINEIHEDAPGGSQEPVDAVARTIGSVKPRIPQDRVVDVYWQQV